MSIHEETIVLQYFMFLTVIVSLGLGSFLNCAAYRMGRHENFIKGHSMCPQCGHELALKDLIPIFSYLFLQGKCRYCKAKISIRYLLTEILFIALMISNLWFFDVTFLALRNLIFLCCLFVISLVDYEVGKIPNSCLVTAVVTWIVGLPLCQRWESSYQFFVYLANHVGAMIFVGGMVWILSLLLKAMAKQNVVGAGDIKLLAVMGLYAGLLNSMFGLLIASVLGLLVGFAVKQHKNSKWEEGYFPFGPAICMAAWIMLCLGDSFANWYLSLFMKW